MTEKISIVTDEISQDLEECKTFLDDHNLFAVELRCIRDKRVPDIERRDLQILKEWARGRDPVILAVSPGLFKCDVEDHTEIRRHLEDTLPRSIEMAVDLEARFLVTFAFHNPNRLPVGHKAVESLAAAAEACAEAGLPLLMENEPGFLACTAGEIKHLIEAVSHPNLFVNWDPLNSNEFEEADLTKGIREIFPLIRHVHVKNGRLRPGTLLAECCSLRAGEIDWPAHLRALKALGYTGHLGVETHYLPFKENSVVVLGELREMLAKIESWGVS